MSVKLILQRDNVHNAGANSYMSVDEAKTYATNRGTKLSSNVDTVAAMLIRAMDYLESQACKYQGKPTYPPPSLQWPRTGVILDNVPHHNEIIPKALIAAQAQLVMAIHEGFDPQPTISPQQYITREKVGEIETEYADPLAIGMQPIFTAVQALLAPLFGECASEKFKLRVMRV